MLTSFGISKNKRASHAKLVAVMAVVIAIIAMVTSTTTSVFSTVEDDGWVEGEDDSQGEISSQEELEEAYEGTEWEDNIGPNEFEEATNDNEDDNNDEDGDNKEETFTCSDGSTVYGDEECPSTGPDPYCDLVSSNYRGVCHDRKDYSEATGLYPCNDGTEKKRWQDCMDATKADNDNSNSNLGSSTEAFVINPNSISTTTNAADVLNCKLDGSADGIQQKFDLVKYQACTLYSMADKAYYDGFVSGCMQVGNTKLICEIVADSGVSDMRTLQTQTSTTTQPTEAIQAAQ